MKDLARSNYIESVTPPILSTSHCELYGTRSCAHARKTIPLAPIHSFTKQMRPNLQKPDIIAYFIFREIPLRNIQATVAP